MKNKIEISEEIKFLESVVCNFKDCDCWNCHLIRQRIEDLKEVNN